MSALRKPRAGQEMGADALRRALDREQPALATAVEIERALRDELPNLISDPASFHRVSREADEAGSAVLRRREIVRLLAEAIPDAEDRERREKFVADKVRIQRDGQRRAATWRKRYEAAAADVVSVLSEMEADRRSVEQLNAEAAALGEIGLHPAEFTLRRQEGSIFMSLPHEVVLPGFQLWAKKTWPQ